MIIADTLETQLWIIVVELGIVALVALLAVLGRIR